MVYAPPTELTSALTPKIYLQHHQMEALRKDFFCTDASQIVLTSMVTIILIWS